MRFEERYFIDRLRAGALAMDRPLSDRDSKLLKMDTANLEAMRRASKGLDRPAWNEEMVKALQRGMEIDLEQNRKKMGADGAASVHWNRMYKLLLENSTIVLSGIAQDWYKKHQTSTGAKERGCLPVLVAVAIGVVWTLKFGL